MVLHTSTELLMLLAAVRLNLGCSATSGIRPGGRGPVHTNNEPTHLVRFSPLPFSSFGGLNFLPLPYNGTNQTWVVAASCCDTLFNETAVVEASRHFGNLLTPGLECNGLGQTVGDSTMGGIGEWGYEFQTFVYPKFASSPCVNLTLPSLALNGIVPNTKLEAMARLNAYYDCRLATATSAPGAAASVFNLIGHYFYAGFGVQRGHTAVVASEIQENINSIQAHFALTRGAGRQYNLPWAIDVSPWDAGFITDYSKKRPWGPASAAGGAGGHSLSLFKRSWYLSYLSGANQLIIEAGGVNLFLEQGSSDGVLPLSPLGEQARTFSDFVKGIHERAIPYVPIAVVLEHAHGFGLGLVLGHDGPRTWNTFELTGSDQVAWSLMQSLWPGSWTIKSKGLGAESNYLVPSPYGDSFDILSEHNFTDSLHLYRVFIAAGNVSLCTEVALLEQWIADGGTVVAFASQLAVDSDTTARLIGAALSDDMELHPKLKVVRDLETSWQNSTSGRPGLANNSRPFCVAQSTAPHASWYIKTGGDPTRSVGWGNTDKCCRVSKAACRWFATQNQCEEAIAQNMECLLCQPAESDIGCPTWGQQPTLPPRPLGLRRVALTTASVLLEGIFENGTVVPIALKHNIGSGTVITLLLESATVLERFGVIEHLLSRLATDVLPFELVDSRGGDMLLQLEIALGRTSTGWQVTVVNNNGVSKQPAAMAQIDGSKRLVTMLRLKEAYGTVSSATLATKNGSSLVVTNNSMQVVVEAGDLVVVLVNLA